MSSKRADREFEQGELSPDRLDSVDLLVRREIEARIIAPLLEAMAEEFGRERVLEITRQTIVNIAREQGAQLAASTGECTLTQFAASLETWQRGDALRIDMLEQTGKRLSFDVTRCRYAEMYERLGASDLGALLSCNRDHALIEGFNPNITLTRTQTIMEGAPCCDFRFALREE